MSYILTPGKNGKPQALPWPRIALAIPLERTVPGAVFHGFMRIIQQGHPVLALPYLRTDLARNRFAEALLESHFTHVLMLDLDHVHPPDVVQRLARWVIEDPTRWVVSGLYFRRGQPYDPCAMIKGGDGQYYALAEWPKNELIKVDILGTGCMLISRQVFETIPGPPWFYYDYSMAGEGDWPTEDIAFSKLCAEHNISLWCDTGTTSPHLTESWIDERAFRQYVEQKGMKSIEIPQGG